MLRLALASNLRSQEGGSKVFMMSLGKDFDKVDGDTVWMPKRRGCAPQRNERLPQSWQGGGEQEHLVIDPLYNRQKP